MLDLMDLSAGYRNSDTAGLARLADRQHGVVAFWQLLGTSGFSRPAIQRLVERHYLHHLYPGVYAVGHLRLTVNGRWMAAVLACGPGALLSHNCAAALHDLQRIPGGAIHVTAPHAQRLKGIRAHTSRSLTEADRSTIDGTPVTSIERTFLDLAQVYHPQRLRSILEAAQRRDLLGRPQGRCAATPRQRPPGAKELRAVLKQLDDEAPWTQSKLEQHFLELIREAGLPEPRTNIRVDDELVDVYWPDHDLVVELDSYGFHRSKRAFEDDRRKDTRHTLAGRRSVRGIRARVKSGQRALLGDLSALLFGGAASGP